MKPRFIPLFIALPLAAAPQGIAQSTYNNSTGDGSTWGLSTNWTPNTVPNATDAEAICNGTGPSTTLPATGALDILIDGNYTVGKLTRSTNTLPLASAQAATFPTSPTSMDATKGLTLQTSTGQPQIQITAGDAFFYSALFGTQGFEKTGAGRFTFRFNSIDHTYTGPIKISAGTLGIEKNSTLGDSANDIEILGGARLFAEPGANSGTITLPASRAITLSGGFNGAQQIGANPAQVNLNIEGNITETDPSGITKTDAGILILSGTNSWTGTTSVNGGVLSLTKPQALPGYDSGSEAFTQSYAVNAGGTLAARFGDASPWTATAMTNLISTTTYSGTGSFGIDTTGNTGDTTLADDLVAAGAAQFTKVGAGKLTLSGSPGFTRIALYDGTLSLASGSTPASGVALVFLKSGATLDLGTTITDASALAHFNGGTTTITNGTLNLPATYSFTATAGGTTLALPSTTATFGRVAPFGGGTTTLTGSSGSLTVNGDFNFDVNGAQNTRLVMSGLSSFTFNRSNRAFRCLPATAATDTTTHELVLSSGTNTVTANLAQVGGATGTSQGNAHQGQLRLGTTNEFRTPTFQVGGFNGSGVVTYQSGLTTPSLKIRGADGTSPATTLLVGETSSGVRSGAGTLDLTNGSADIAATDVIIGRHIANSTSPSTTSSVTIPDGTVTATNLTLARKVGAGSPLTVANFTQGGGTVTVDNLVMVETADNASPNVASATQNLQANYNLNGGTLAAKQVKAGLLATPITAGNTQRNLILRGGMLTNATGSDLTLSGISIVVSGVTTTIVDSTAGQKVSLAASATYSARMNSASSTSGALQVDGDIDLSAEPAFNIADDATTPALLNPGTKLVLIDYQDGSLTGTFAGLADGATVNVTKGAVTNSFVLDYNDPAYGGKAVTLTIPGGAGYDAWATTNGITGEPFTGDFDQDGISNGVEYGLGKSPTTHDLPAGAFSGNTVTFTKGADAITNADVSWAIETSTTLAPGSWTPEVTQAAGDPAATISFTFTPGTPERKFARLRVLKN